MEGKYVSARHKDNPFTPYLDTYIEAGLDAADQAALKRLQESGDCIFLHELLAKGFLKLYPFLAPAFDDPKRRRQLDYALESNYEPAVRRCHVYVRLNEMAKKRSPEDFLLIDMLAEFTEPDLVKHPPEEGSDRQIWREINFTSGTLAFCFDYPWSIEDILTSANSRGGMVITPRQEWYLAARGRARGILDEAQYRDRIEAVLKRSGFDEIPRDLLEARSVVGIEQIDGIDILWPTVCRQVREERR